MKREFLEGLGLDKSVIDSIMTEHGKSVSLLKEKCKDAEKKDVIIAALTSERDTLSTSLSSESEKHAAFKRGIIDGIVKEARPTSLLAEKELCRALSECDGDDLMAELQRIMDSDPDAFKREKVDAPVFAAFSGADTPISALNYRSVR